MPSFVERDETNEDPKGKNSNNPDKWECGHSEESCYSFNIPAHAQALQTTNVRHLRGEMQSDKSNNTNAFASLESMILKNRPTTANKKRKNRHSFLNTFEEKKKATPTESSRAIPSPWSSTRTGGSGCFIPSGRSTARNGSCPKEDDPDHFNVQRDYDERLKPSESAPVKSGTNSNRTTKRPLNGSMSQFIVGSR